MSAAPTPWESYPIWHADYDALHHLLEGYAKVMVLTDELVARHVLNDFIQHAKLKEVPIVTLPPGESHKDLDHCRHIWDAMLRHGMDRQSLLINLGGGVITDIGGFCASVYKRGIDFIHVPTTLLAMVDAAIGSKTGIDWRGYKNQIGTYCPPVAVFIDLRWLDTLPSSEVKNGVAEMLKIALVADAELWSQLQDIEEVRDFCRWDYIERAIEQKRAIVRRDARDRGVRQILNFGHTVGHALESWYLHRSQHIAHGHAVAIGMYYESRLSVAKVGLSSRACDEIAGVLRRFFEIPAFSKDEARELWRNMLFDKKTLRNTVYGVGLRSIGRAEWGVPFLEDEIVTLLSGAGK